MQVEFDPAKDVRNIARHGVSWHSAAQFDWSSALEREDDRYDYGHRRFVARGLIAERVHVLVFTPGSHDGAVRVISLRRAEPHEARFYLGQI